jgi:hypothetical protein
MPQFAHLEEKSLTTCNCLHRPDKAGIIVAIDRNIEILNKKNDSISKHEIKEFTRIKEKVENTPDCK